MKLLYLPLERVLFETCGEDMQIVEEATVRIIAPNVFHVQYKEDDPMEGIDFKILIVPEKHNGKHTYLCHVFDSVYADNGDFYLD